MSAAAGPLPSVSAPSGLLTNNKVVHGKSSKPGSDDDVGLNGMLSASAGASEADLYDPDQPLWNSDRPETSSAILRLSSPKSHDADPLWDADTSDGHRLRLSAGVDNEHNSKSIMTTTSLQSTASSVWGRIGNSGIKLQMTGKNDNAITALGCMGNEVKEDLEEALPSVTGTVDQGKQTITEELAPKAINSSATPKLRNDPMRNVVRPSQKALRTLFVNGIPQKSNKREVLLSHFQRFGEVIDIYIPLNSEKAFVQFSRREEAEAALKAPDAVMGNRFIKLWWANRDSIPDDGMSSGNSISSAPHGVKTASVSSQPSVADRAKDNLPSAPSKVSALVSDVPVLAALHPKPVVPNGPKAATPPLQKKQESLELLKEELRIKQEMLEQKRNDFRRQLDKLEKQVRPDFHLYLIFFFLFKFKYLSHVWEALIYNLLVLTLENMFTLVLFS